MTMAPFILVATSILLVGGTITALVSREIRRRHLHRWLGSFLVQSVQRRRARRRTGPIDVLICIADHFEPSWGGASDPEGEARVAAWAEEYPKNLGGFRDSDGRAPRHTFFYPIDQYIPRHVDALAGLCRSGYGEVEIHLHHDRDTAANLESTLRGFTRLLVDRHGLLGRWPDGRVAYGFIHGNWALDNARPDGRWCGVNNELDVLRRTGCYADFTMPSAPDTTQTRKINSIYYAVGDPCRTKSHDHGVDVGTAPPPEDGLMLIQGPLRLWRPRDRWVPRIENGCVQDGQPPTPERLDQWLRAGVGVASRPEWVFIKLHTHGAKEANRRVLLGEPMMEFHRSLARRAMLDAQFRYHYVTAREMYNLAKAAEAGWTGSVASAKNHVVTLAGPDNPSA
jgi:hypothetical protein